MNLQPVEEDGKYTLIDHLLFGMEQVIGYTMINLLNSYRSRGARNSNIMNSESVITERNSFGRVKENIRSLDESNSAEMGNRVQERLTKGSPTKELHGSMQEKDTAMISSLDLQEKKVLMAYSESNESSTVSRGELVKLQSQVEKLAEALTQTHQRSMQKQQEEYALSDTVELTGKMSKCNQELLMDIKDLVTKISNDVLMPSQQLHGSVSKTMLKLEDFAEQLNEKVMNLIDKEREQYNEELSFQKMEKKRLVEEIGSLRQELQRGKDEWSSERDKLVTEIELSLKRKEDIERKYRWEQVRDNFFWLCSLAHKSLYGSMLE
jgi:hypothetical protein